MFKKETYQKTSSLNLSDIKAPFLSFKHVEEPSVRFLRASFFIFVAFHFILAWF